MSAVAARLRRPPVALPRTAGGVLAALRAEWPLVVLVGLFSCAFAVPGLARHAQFLSGGYDLGIFDQTVWQYSRLQAPENTVRGVPNILGDHFSPILVLLAPLYWVWADPRMLIAAQALLLATSFVPVFLFCASRVGRLPAYVLTLAYGLFWGLSAGAVFDFHEVAFSPLLIASAILLADRGRWRAFAVAFVLLLLVKEDQTIFAAFLGVWIALRGEVRRGLALAAIAAAYFLVVSSVVIPFFADGRDFAYWTYQDFGEGPFSSLKEIVLHPSLVPAVAFDEPEKVRLMLYLFVPFLCLAAYSSLAVLALPLVLERVLSTNELHWLIQFHHTLPICAVLVMAAADAMPNVARLVRREPWRPWIALALSLVILAGNVQVAARFPLADLRKAETWRLRGDADDRERARLLRETIPSDASVRAQTGLVPHLSGRERVYVLGGAGPRAEFLALFPGGPTPGAASADASAGGRDIAPTGEPDLRGYRLVREGAGVAIYRSVS